MNPISRWFVRARVDRELAEEMAAHLAEKTDDLIADGHTPDQACSHARRQFGNLTQQQESSRREWGWTWLEELLSDLRFAARVLVKIPAYSLTVIAVLGLGIGMNTAIFSAVNAVLLSRLPYPDPDRLVDLRQVNRNGGLMNVSGPDFRDWRDQIQSMAFLASYDETPVTLSGHFTPERTRMGIVSSTFFDALGVHAIIGRTFTREEQKPGGPAAVVLGYSMGTRCFGSASAAIGKAVRIDGMSLTVVGVMDPSFDFPLQAQVWIPQEAFPDDSARSAHNYHVLGRLRPGVSIPQAQSGMNVIAAALAKTYIDDKDQGVLVRSLHDEIVGSVRPSLLILFAAVTLVLLIACVNISNLQLARATVRIREFALRTALGARRGRLIRQLLTESVLLAAAGGALGLLIAAGGTAILRDSAPASLPRLDFIRIDTGVLLFCSVLSVFTGILFGLLPALAGSRTDLNHSLKASSGKATSGVFFKRSTNGLIVGEIGLAIVLLAGSALLLKSYWKLSHIGSGLHSTGVFTSDLSLPVDASGMPDAVKISALTRALLSRVGNIPGVGSAALIYPLPVRDAGSNGDFEIEGQPLPSDPHLNPNAFYRLASSGYFRTFGLPILRGRDFDPHDNQSSPPVAIVNQSFAAQFFPKGEPVGKRIRFLGFELKPQFMTIVGIVPNVRAFGLNKPPDAEVFAEFEQHPGTAPGAALIVRAPFALRPAIQGAIESINPDTPVHFINMEDVITGTIARQRFETALLTAFAAFALLLAVIGVYGLLSYTVTRRTAELGVRMALGASRRSVLSLILREGAVLIATGLALGLGCALLLARFLSALLFGVSSSDPASFVAVSILFAAVALFGCYLPGRRAANIDPLTALRYE